MSSTNSFLGFDILDKLGEGAFSATYLGHQNPRYVAIKIIEIPNPQTSKSLSAEELRSPSFQKSLRKTSAELNSVLQSLVATNDRKGVLRYYDYQISVDPEQGVYQLGILTEYLENLDQYLHKYDVRVRSILKLGQELCDGLHAMASQGVLHGNIKESNIFYDKIKGFKLGDFFFNDILIQTLHISEEYHDFGYRFLAPEAYDNRPYDSKTDMFALGILLYKLLNNGILPYQVADYHLDIKEIRDRFMTERILPPTPLIEAPLLEVINKATAFDPADRFQDFLAFKEALRSAMRVIEIPRLDRVITPNIITVADRFFVEQKEDEDDLSLIDETLFTNQNERPEIKEGVPFTISLGAEPLSKRDDAPAPSEEEVNTSYSNYLARKKTYGLSTSSSTADFSYQPGPNESVILDEYTHELAPSDELEPVEPHYNFSEDELEDDALKNKIGMAIFVVALIAVCTILFFFAPYITSWVSSHLGGQK